MHVCLCLCHYMSRECACVHVCLTVRNNTMPSFCSSVHSRLSHTLIFLLLRKISRVSERLSSCDVYLFGRLGVSTEESETNSFDATESLRMDESESAMNSLWEGSTLCGTSLPKLISYIADPSRKGIFLTPGPAHFFPLLLSSHYYAHHI